MWHPMKYAAMLAEKMQRHNATAWLVNTGWTAGGYGVGYRMKLRHTRSIVDAIHSGELKTAETTATPIFGLQVFCCISTMQVLYFSYACGRPFFATMVAVRTRSQLYSISSNDRDRIFDQPASVQHSR